MTTAKEPPSFRRLETEVLTIIAQAKKERSLMERIAPYRKFLIALLGAVISTVVQFYGDNQYVLIAVALLTALGVYQVPNAVKK